VKISEIINDWKKNSVSYKPYLKKQLMVRLYYSVAFIIYISLLYYCGSLTKDYFVINSFLEIFLILSICFFILHIIAIFYLYTVDVPDDLLIKISESDIPMQLKKSISAHLHRSNGKIDIKQLLVLEKSYFEEINKNILFEKFDSSAFTQESDEKDTRSSAAYMNRR